MSKPTKGSSKGLLASAPCQVPLCDSHAVSLHREGEAQTWPEQFLGRIPTQGQQEVHSLAFLEPWLSHDHLVTKDSLFTPVPVTSLNM